MAGTIYCIIDAAVYMFTTLYFWKMSSDWQPYFIVLLCINAIAVLGCMVLPESPRILFALGK